MTEQQVYRKWLPPSAHWLAWLPAACLLCQAPLAPDQALCAACCDELPRVRSPCPHCGLPSSGGLLACGTCQKKPPRWDACIGGLAYAGNVPGLVHRFKDGRERLAGRVLTEQLLMRLQERPPESPWPDALLPVPLHRYRLWRRGFNPARDIANRLGKALGLAVEDRLLQRQRPTPHQQGLSAAARRRNLRAAFTLRGDVPASVALVDDVVTTGSTVAEISRLLKRRGVQRVEVWCLARTLKPGDD